MIKVISITQDKKHAVIDLYLPMPIGNNKVKNESVSYADAITAEGKHEIETDNGTQYVKRRTRVRFSSTNLDDDQRLTEIEKAHEKLKEEFSKEIEEDLSIAGAMIEDKE